VQYLAAVFSLHLGSARRSWETIHPRLQKKGGETRGYCRPPGSVGFAAGAIAAAPYYGGAGYYSGGPYAAYGYPVQDYATRNGFVCRPGTTVRLDDGLQYPCQ
jgi:hypothetical protein